MKITFLKPNGSKLKPIRAGALKCGISSAGETAEDMGVPQPRPGSAPEVVPSLGGGHHAALRDNVLIQ